MAWAREEFKREHSRSAHSPVRTKQAERTSPKPKARQAAETHDPEKIFGHLSDFREAFIGSLAEQYVNDRGISSEIAVRYKLGYAAYGKWPHKGDDGRPKMQAQRGRVVFLGYGPGFSPVNLYSRAIPPCIDLIKHAHLPGAQGWFNGAEAFCHKQSDGPLFICEGAFDALSLIAAGYPHAIAIFGVNRWRWEWLRDVQHIVFALDADSTGQRRWRELGEQGLILGKSVQYLDIESYGGAKDVNEAWMKGKLNVTY
jgi:DNA primase